MSNSKLFSSYRVLNKLWKKSLLNTDTGISAPFQYPSPSVYLFKLTLLVLCHSFWQNHWGLIYLHQGLSLEQVHAQAYPSLYQSQGIVHEILEYQFLIRVSYWCPLEGAEPIGWRRVLANQRAEFEILPEISSGINSTFSFWLVGPYFSVTNFDSFWRCFKSASSL